MDALTKKEIIDLILPFAILLFSLLIWYWICFRNGAQRWSHAIINYHKKIGHGFIASIFLFKPIALKVIITIYLLAVIIGLYFSSPLREL